MRYQEPQKLVHKWLSWGLKTGLQLLMSITCSGLLALSLKRRTNWWRIDCCYILLVKLIALNIWRISNLNVFRLNHSSSFSNIYTKGELGLCRIEELLSSCTYLKHSEAELRHEVHSRKEPGSEMKELYKVIFLVCFALCYSPRGNREDFEILCCKMSLK